MKPAAFALLLLAGCNNVAPDGYDFEGKEYAHREFTVSVTEHPSLAALQSSGPGVGEGRELQAWSKLHPRDRRCEVHIVDPDARYAPEWLGHEIAHCAYGQWHQ